MPRSSGKTQGSPQFAAFAEALQQWVLAYRMRHVREVYKQRDVAAAMGINATMFSKFVRGREVPTSGQCLLIARYLSLDVQEVLAAAGYPDIAKLIHMVASDPTRGTARDRQYIISWLEAAQEPQWHGLDWRTSPHKENADEMLATEGDYYRKARKYADAVYSWAIDPQRNAARSERTTYDHVVIMS